MRGFSQEGSWGHKGNYTARISENQNLEFRGADSEASVSAARRPLIKGPLFYMNPNL